MTPRSRSRFIILLTVASLGTACRLRLERPELEPARMIEPRLIEPAGAVADTPNATTVRLLETQGRGHIGRRLLRQLPDGEVSEDPTWLWTSTPVRYLDSALRLAIAANPDIHLVDDRGGRSLAVTLVTWQLETAPSPRLVGAVEVEVTTADRAVHSSIVRAEEAVSADLPGDLAAAAGRLLARLAAESLSRVARPSS
jgi:hypothetical protein